VEDGSPVGVCVGDVDGTLVPINEGEVVGRLLGKVVGEPVKGSIAVGKLVGFKERRSVGASERMPIGEVGFVDGTSDGELLGNIERELVGDWEGPYDGPADGKPFDLAEGRIVG